jgi:hypothetical protein
MDERREFSISEHVQAISTRSHVDSGRLAAWLVGRSWPGGLIDRSERGALEWMRQWRPGGPALDVAGCSCATGHCLVCN